MTNSVRVNRLTVRYGARVALADVDLTAERGMTVAVIGPNGSGKSTLLSAIAGLVTPSSGTVTVDRRNVALVLQATRVDTSLPITVRETVQMARYPHRRMFGRFRSTDHAAIDRAMERTDVSDLANHQIHALSGGQRQRVLVAQGIAQEADLLLLDEPMTGVDIVSRRAIHQIIDQERAAGRTVVMTTHSIEDATLCDLVVLLCGRVVATGPPDLVINDENLHAVFGAQGPRFPSRQLTLNDADHHVAR